MEEKEEEIAPPCLDIKRRNGDDWAHDDVFCFLYFPSCYLTITPPVMLIMTSD